MEKLNLNKKKIIIISIVIFSLIVISFYQIFSKKIQNEKYFDIILASLYNKDVSNSDEKILFLSTLSQPNISFFGDLKLSSIDNLEKYQKLDKDLLILKRSIVSQDFNSLKTLSKDDTFIFRNVARIFYLNIDLRNFNEIYSGNNVSIENFFLKAVKRYQNEIN